MPIPHTLRCFQISESWAVDLGISSKLWARSTTSSGRVPDPDRKLLPFWSFALLPQWRESSSSLVDFTTLPWELCSVLRGLACWLKFKGNHNPSFMTGKMWHLEKCPVWGLTPHNCWLSVTAALSWGSRAGKSVGATLPYHSPSSLTANRKCCLASFFPFIHVSFVPRPNVFTYLLCQLSQQL